ncbi:MAG: Ig-like domain-containing protein [Planctomycetes bacterium]|nr:Ig-like domain-containing protein [Planctomycetota bacterium]
MAIKPFLAISGATALAVSFAGCGGGGGGSLFNGTGQGTTAFKLASCSLGGSPCGGASNIITQTQSLSFTFNEPVSPGSVTSETLQILEVDPSGGGGVEPPGQRQVSGNTVIFTPEVSFDSNGNVSYGFKPAKTYRITIPKSPNTAIQSTSGHVNTTAIQQTVSVSNQLADIIPGPPSASLTFPTSPTGATHDTPIEVTFNDIMNVATLVNKLQGTSQTLSVFVDLDGDLNTSNDQIVLTGTWDVNFDTIGKKTTVRFTHTSPFPSPGPTGKRAIVCQLNKLVIKDLGGNSLDPNSPNAFSFQTGPCNVQNAFDIVEDFGTNTNENGPESGANMWNPAGNPGLLVRGVGGGNGMHGPLLIDSTNDLIAVGAYATDGTSVPNDASFGWAGRIPFSVKAVDALPINSDNTSKPLTVTDGIFQFTTLQILNATNTLRFEGPGAPARIYVRGKVNIIGTLDVGGNPGSRSSTNTEKALFAGINTPCTAKNALSESAGTIFGWAGGATGCSLFPQYPVGKPGGRGGALAGDGGNGGDLPINIPGLTQSNYPTAGFKSFDGGNGLAAGPFPGSPGTVAGGGVGTFAVPVLTVSGQNLYALNSLTVPAAFGFGSGVNYDSCVAVGCSGSGNSICDGIVPQLTGTTPTYYSIQIGAPAGGGASQFENGTVGTWCQESAVTAACGTNGANKKTVPLWTTVTVTIPSNPPASNAFPYYPSPPTGTGGLKGIVGAEPPSFGADGVGNFSMLRAGAGGGGGGTNCFGTSGTFGSAQPTWTGTVFPIVSVGCAGGGGGGVLQIQSGRDFTLASGGFIRATGGDGGDHQDHPTCSALPGCGSGLDNFTAGKLWGQTMSPGGAGGGGTVLIQSNGAISLPASSVNVSGGVGGDGRLPTAANASTSAIAFLSKFVFPGIATNVPFRLRGGDGGNGRWHYQSTANTNLDTAFTPSVQASSHSSAYTGINIAAADFSSAESGWLAFPPTSGSFVQLTGYELTIQTTGGPVVLVQDDVNTNQVLTQSFAAGGTLPIRILFQGTRPNALGQPDPAARTSWTDKVSTLSIASPKFVRFAVVFSRATAIANPTVIGVDKIDVKGTGENCLQ